MVINARIVSLQSDTLTLTYTHKTRGCLTASIANSISPINLSYFREASTLDCSTPGNFNRDHDATPLTSYCKDSNH